MTELPVPAGRAAPDAGPGAGAGPERPRYNTAVRFQRAPAAVLSLALLAAAPVSAAPSRATAASAAGQDHPGAQPYRQVCGFCHGTAGRGDIAPALVPFGFDADYLLAVVREGYGQMPPISRRELDDDAVRQVAGYLEALTSPPAAAGTAATPGEAAPEVEEAETEAAAAETGSAAAPGEAAPPGGGREEAARPLRDGGRHHAGEAPPGGGQEEAAAGTVRYDGPRTPEGRPDLNGIWQTLNAASWDVRPHNAQDGVPAGLGVVEGGEIPYRPWAAAQQERNYANRLSDDPVRKCYLPGVPRITYMPFPFRILQTPDHVVVTYEFAHAVRIIYTDGSGHPLPNDFWMGDSRGHWDGDTLVVDTTHFNGLTWFDAAGNFHGDQLQVVERYTPITPYHVDYEVTIEDPEVFTRPWTMRMPLYRRMEDRLQLLDYDCVDFILQALTAPEEGAR